MPRRKLKLFVWTGVLTDWSDGIMFALAYDVEHARRLILEANAGSGGVPDPDVVADLKLEPRVVEKPEGFYLYGGG